MSEWFGQLLSIIATTLGLVSVPDAGALGLAIALLAVTALTLAVVLSVRPVIGADEPHPLRAIDVGTLLAQSDPDAAGHPRPRASGLSTAA
ncbi:DUF6412 domain-containing protein [Microbacterium sp. SA39]|uniref:DUF6412 domain-containing protein n=1 Tax=Microbacterium sp. SA39 TaxID=1263625 RepID=UPI0005FA4C36|nr:DUF6412 domain-containing protein [Microbacterium sp. SA39]KJQ53981.1 hypothetical protein RS85_02050 [Microbacterium sp. SA39]